jgi:hypothetical protein
MSTEELGFFHTITNSKMHKYVEAKGTAKELNKMVAMVLYN